MNIRIMQRRTKTYIAGDWDGDKAAIDKLHQWNNSLYWNLHFVDVHDLTQSRDSSQYCSIKRSLKARMDISKTFILIVGAHTKSLVSGACYRCAFYKTYVSLSSRCIKGYPIDNRSFVDYECDMALNPNIKIVVLYNSTSVDKKLCPASIRDVGTHIAMKKTQSIDWDYQAVKNTIQ